MTTTAGRTEHSQATSHAAVLPGGPSTTSPREKIYHRLISKGDEGASGVAMQTILAINLSPERRRRGELFTKGKVAGSGRRVMVWVVP